MISRISAWINSELFLSSGSLHRGICQWHMIIFYGDIGHGA